VYGLPVVILGVDPGSRICGYGALEVVGFGKFRYLECGVVTSDDSQPMEQRLAEIVSGLGEVIEEVRPQVIALEDVFTRKNHRSALALAQARGAVLAMAGQVGLPVVSYPAPVVKKAVTGHGRADKERVAQMVCALVGLKSLPAVDATDALAVAIAHGVKVKL
jgi:crossover junction endodeoxyribonuclease RuvC